MQKTTKYRNSEINVNPSTTKLFRPTFIAKEVVATPWICDFPAKLLCTIVHGYVFGVEEFNGDS